MRERVILLIVCATLAACRFSSEPSDPFGDYQLTRYEDPFSQQIIPVSLADYTGSPGDSLRILGGTFSLRSNHRWQRERTTMYRRAGSWGSAATTSDSGAYVVSGGSGSYLELMLLIPDPNQPYERAFADGKEFQEGGFIYTRR